MSATTTRLPLSQAREIAWELMALLGPYCERIEVAGSVRRERPEIGDLELVAAPLLVERVENDLFGAVRPLPPINVLAEQTDRLLTDGQIWPWFDSHAKLRWGKKYRAFIFREVKVDLFMVVQPAQWGVILALRTGSNDFSHRLVTPVERDAYSPDGRNLGRGWMPRGMFCKDGRLWRDGEPLETPEERDLFQQLGRPYVPAPEREVRP